MPLKSKAERLQQDLLNKGFLSIEICDVIDDEYVSIEHCVLTKSNKDSEHSDSCILYKRFDLSSQEAIELLEKWVEQISIYPDPRRL